MARDKREDLFTKSGTMKMCGGWGGCGGSGNKRGGQCPKCRGKGMVHA